MMDITKITAGEKDFDEKILPLLEDEVFHITSSRNYRKILKDGYIKNNGELKYKTTYPQSEGSYFQKRKCVCLFDGRNKDKLKEGIISFQYGKILDRESIIMCLTKDEHKNIEISKRQLGDGALIQYVEVGYKDKIDIQLIYKTIIITPKRKYFKKGSLSQLHNEARKIERKQKIQSP